MIFSVKECFIFFIHIRLTHDEFPETIRKHFSEGPKMTRDLYVFYLDLTCDKQEIIDRGFNVTQEKLFVNKCLLLRNLEFPFKVNFIS